MEIVGCYNFAEDDMIPCEKCTLKQDSKECFKFRKDDEMVYIWYN